MEALILSCLKVEAESSAGVKWKSTLAASRANETVVGVPPAPGAAKVELLEVKRMSVKILAMEAKRAKTGARRLSFCEKILCF